MLREFATVFLLVGGLSLIDQSTARTFAARPWIRAVVMAAVLATALYLLDDAFSRYEVVSMTGVVIAAGLGLVFPSLVHFLLKRFRNDPR